ncbi:UNVERIFIED_CONTAM: hypothetical protein NCL1_14963 [Trichonephila clavipes]
MFLLATGDVDPDYVKDQLGKNIETDETIPKTSIKISEKEEVIDSGNPGIPSGICQIMVSVSIALVTSCLLRPGT